MRAGLIGVLNTRSSRNPPDNTTSTNSTKPSGCTSFPDANSRPTRSQPVNSHRAPLQSRNQNAMMRGSQKALTAKSGNSNMPSYDNKSNASRPLVPTLSASAKGSNRPPLTPRVAGSAPLAPTPSARRGQRPFARSNTPDAQKEEPPTSMSSFINNNITPRSGPRKVRVDSTNTTPTSTPTGTPVPTSNNDTFRGAQDATMQGQGPGLGISGMDRDAPKRQTVSFITAGLDRGGLRSPAAAGDSKFFFASDAKPAQASRPTLQSKSSSSFFYANGETIPKPPQSSGGSAVGSTIGEERSQQPKFFHANGTPDLQLSPSPHFAPSRPSSVVSTNSRMTLSRASTASPSTFSPPPSQRPTSPSKLNQYGSIQSLQNPPTLQSAILPRPQAGVRGKSTGVVASRKASIESSKTTGHGRSSSIGSGPPSRKVSRSSSFETAPPSTPANLVTTGLISTPEEAIEPNSIDEVSSEPLRSPIKGQSIDELNELAANARRERKVLDLEITNSSLAAINRTLEREMRKQTAELRRYRRLSRSGRLSIASTSLRESTDTLSIVGGTLDGGSLSDMSEEEDQEDEEEEFSDTSDSMDDGSLSPSAIAESDLRHRKKDEKRLQLDLSKHQQLLIDSQKMNQSLKRCLGWTEALISEGQKALEYRVKISDVALGGRVLAPDEVEPLEDDEADNEGMSDIGARMLREARQKAAASASTMPWGSEGRDDRDSGIEIDGSQRERLESSFGSPQIQ